MGLEKGDSHPDADQPTINDPRASQPAPPNPSQPDPSLARDPSIPADDSRLSDGKGIPSSFRVPFGDPNDHSFRMGPASDHGSELPETVTREPAGWKLPSIEGYEVLSVLGKGGMGIVYQARQLGLKRLVALKMIIGEDLVSEDELSRFRSEAEAVAQLHHPNIIQIHEIGTSKGIPFFSLEYADGGTLAKVINGNPQPPEDAARIIEILAVAMQHAHDAGFIHRDLKPANILLTREGSQKGDSSPSHSREASPSCRWGVPKIADFGLAKKFNDHSGQTQSGAILGTPAYMPPEQSMGQIRGLGPLVDVYALGSMLYELLTGRPPFRGATILDTLRMVRDQEPMLPSGLQSKIPKDLETICLTCLQKEPLKRYGSAALLAEDLRRFLSGEPIKARPVSWAERFWRWCRRNPDIASLAGGIAATLILGSVVSLYYAARAIRGEKQAEENARLAEVKRQESDRRRYAAEYREALQKWRDGKLDEVREILAGLEPTEPGEIDHRHFEWHYLNRLCDLEHRVLRGHTKSALRVACSSDGSLMASAGQDGTVRLWERATGQARGAPLNHQCNVFSIAFSPDDRFLASAGEDGTIRVWNVATQSEAFWLRDGPGMVHSISFHPNRDELSAGDISGRINVWNLKTHTHRQMKKPGAPVSGVLIHPKTGEYYTAGPNRSVLVWDSAAENSRTLLKDLPGEISAMALSANGQFLAVCFNNLIIRVWPTEGSTTPVIIPVGEGMPTAMTMSPDGQKIATADDHGMIRIRRVLDGRVLLTLRGHSTRVTNLRFSPDAWQLFSSSDDKTIRIWDAAGNTENQVIRRKTIFSAVAIGEEGKRAATACQDGSILVWDVETGRELPSLTGHKGVVNDLRTLPGGERVISIGSGGSPNIWDLKTGGNPLTLPAVDEKVLNSCAISENGQWFIAGGEKGILYVWDLATRQLMRQVSVHEKQIIALAINPTGTLAISLGNDQTTRLTDLADNKTLWSLSDNGRGPVAFSPDGKTMLAGDDWGVWDLTNSDAIRKVRALNKSAESQLNCVFYSSDGKRIVGIGYDLLVHVWDATNGDELLTLEPPILQEIKLESSPDNGVGVAISRDGKHLLAAQQNGVLRICNADLLSVEMKDTLMADSLIRHLSANGPNDLEDRIRRQKGISDAVRNIAFAEARRRQPPFAK